MYSFRRITMFVPQCRHCGTSVADPDDPGRDVLVSRTLLPPRIRDGLVAAGWQVDRDDSREGQRASPDEDKLTCPECLGLIRSQARKRHDALHQPPVREIDMADRFGSGWTLRQRAGDADDHLWLVAHNGDVKGLVRRYRRAGDRGWSRSWEAKRVTPAGLRSLPATSSASWSERSLYLWRSRELAAWGVATNPAYGEPNPAWVRHRSAGTTN